MFVVVAVVVAIVMVDASVILSACAGGVSVVGRMNMDESAKRRDNDGDDTDCRGDELRFLISGNDAFLSMRVFALVVLVFSTVRSPVRLNECPF